MASSLSKQFGPKGYLHKKLHVPADKKIPVSKLRAAVKRGGLEGKRAALVLRFDHPKGK